MHHAYIDRFSRQDSPIHRLDARAKLLVVLAYTGVLVSFGRYDLAALAPMAVLPLAMLWLAGVPVSFALRRVLTLCPFVALLVLALPFYDRAVQPLVLGPWAWEVGGGWLSAAAVLARFALGLMALTALVSSTQFSLLLAAMRRLGAPAIFCAVLGFLYRYIFVLIDQVMRVRRASDFRGAARAPAARRLATAGGVVGYLMVRTLERSQRVHLAMLARGYTGQNRGLQQLHWRAADWAFVMACVVYLAAARMLPLL